MNRHNVMVVQSRTTGRFLLKKVDDVWTFPSVIELDPSKSIVYMAMDDCGDALGQNVEENTWVLDYVPDGFHQLFHVWVSDEPLGNGELEWCSLFMFPETTSEMVCRVMGNRLFLENSLHPQC